MSLRTDLWQRGRDHLELGVTWSCPLRQSQQMPTLFASSEKKCSMNQGCHKRFYRHMFFRIIYFFPFETSATASCGYMLDVLLDHYQPSILWVWQLFLYFYFGRGLVTFGRKMSISWTHMFLKVLPACPLDMCFCLVFNQNDEWDELRNKRSKSKKAMA